MKRRSNGEGTYRYDEARDRWVWKGYYNDVSGETKRKTIVAKKRKELRSKVESFQAEQAQGGVPSNLTLSKFSEQWLSAIKPTIKPRTYEAYRASVINHLIPTLGKYRLKKLLPTQIQEMLNLLAKKYSPATVNTIRRHLIIMLNAARDNGHIIRNPASVTKAVKDTKQNTLKVLSQSELQQLLDVVHAKDYLLLSKNADIATIYMAMCTDILISLLACTGLRIGEALALKWSDFDEVSGSIIVSKTLVNGISGLCIGSPKTETSNRTLLLPYAMIQKLETWHKKQQRYATHLGNLFTNKYDLIFANSHGNLMSYSNWSRRYWHKAIAAAGLPKTITPHCLRHTLASLLIAKGTPLQVVSRQLGHAGTDVTLRIYTHMIPGTEKVALTAIESIFTHEEKGKTSPDAATSEEVAVINRKDPSLPQ